MVMDTQRIYLALPIWAQEWALSRYARHLDRMYYGPDFASWVQRFNEMERYSAAQIAEYQLQELHRILCAAFRSVPWFRAMATWRGLREGDFTSYTHLRLLPIMEKHPIRQDPWRFISDEYPKKRLWLEKTSGTTGTSLQIFWPREMLPRWWALHEVRVRYWAGISQSVPRAMVGGRPIIRGSTDQPPYWRYVRHWKQLYMSSYHISPVTVPQYIAALQQYESGWITGYGSAIALLGEYLVDHPTPLRIRAAVTSGDTVSERQRQAIERGFRCRMLDYYGSAEGCCVISECEQGRLHVQPEAGILEIIDEHGAPCPPGVDGEFICTGFGNDVMPLIRYRTGDYGSWAMEQNCPCGRKSPLVNHITGRTDDYLVLADGRRIGRLSTAMKKAPSVKQAQLVQDKPGHAWLLVVPDYDYRDAHGETLVEDILSRIGERAISIEVRTVSDIPPTPVGKHVLVRRIMGNAELQAQYHTLIERSSAEGVSV
ncbi:MAG: phenylacetate--CoA ligase family protein [Armatimonadota bacterium]